MRSLLLPSLLLGAVLSAGACTDDSAWNADVPLGEPVAAVDRSTTASLSSLEGAADLLFVARGDASVQQGRLELTTAGEVTWFTDRPERSAGSVPPAALEQMWDGLGFADDPPNAVLSTAERSIAVELRDPRFDEATSTLSVAVTRIDSEDLPEGDLGTVELFIDDAITCITDPYIMTISNPPPGLTTSQADCWTAVGTALETLDAGLSAALEASTKVPSMMSPGAEGQGVYMSPDFDVELFGVDWRCVLVGETWSCDGPPTATGQANIFVTS